MLYLHYFKCVKHFCCFKFGRWQFEFFTCALIFEFPTYKFLHCTQLCNFFLVVQFVRSWFEFCICICIMDFSTYRYLHTARGNFLSVKFLVFQFVRSWFEILHIPALLNFLNIVILNVHSRLLSVCLSTTIRIFSIRQFFGYRDNCYLACTIPTFLY